jgi:hypothetical protein
LWRSSSGPSSWSSSARPARCIAPDPLPALAAFAERLAGLTSDSLIVPRIRRSWCRPRRPSAWPGSASAT